MDSSGFEWVPDPMPVSQLLTKASLAGSLAWKHNGHSAAAQGQRRRAREEVTQCKTEVEDKR